MNLLCKHLFSPATHTDNELPLVLLSINNLQVLLCDRAATKYASFQQWTLLNHKFQLSQEREKEPLSRAAKSK